MSDPYLKGIMERGEPMTPQPPASAAPTLGPYWIWGEDEQVSGVPCIEIGRGNVPSPEAKSLCLVQSTLDESTDEFVLTDEDWANARLFAAAWATAAERDRLGDMVHHLVSALEHVKRFSSIPRKWPEQDRQYNNLIRDARELAGPMSDKVRLGGAALEEARKP